MASTKEVTIIARYAHKTNGKLNGTVTYLVRASNGKDTYCTTLIDDKASGCSCPAKSSCYHKTQLENKETERTEEWIAYRAEVAKTLARQFMTAEIVEQVARQLIAPVKPTKIAKIIETAVQATIPATKNTDMLFSALTTNKGFALMR